MSIDPGTKIMTAPGAVGTSDASGRVFPVRVYFVSMVATAATAGILSLYNGTSASGTTCLQLRALATSADTIDIGYGLLFTSGCYCDFTTGSMNVSIIYHQEPA